MIKRVQDIASDVIERLHRWVRKDEAPVLIALDGRSRVGKSTIAQAIAARLDATVIAGDDFYSGGSHVHDDLTPEDLVDLCLDRDRLQSVLKDLKAGADARFAPFDWTAFDGRRTERETILPARAALVLEGVYAFHPDFRDLVDLAILVETPRAIRMQRLLTREGEISTWEQQWLRAEAWYFANLAPVEVFHHHIVNA
ncbi:MAG: uridine kinase [Maricaulaceae bacterium]